MNLRVISAIRLTGLNKFLFGRVIQDTTNNQEIHGLVMPLIKLEVTQLAI